MLLTLRNPSHPAATRRASRSASATSRTPTCSTRPRGRSIRWVLATRTRSRSTRPTLCARPRPDRPAADPASSTSARSSSRCPSSSLDGSLPVSRRKRWCPSRNICSGPTRPTTRSTTPRSPGWLRRPLEDRSRREPCRTGWTSSVSRAQRRGRAARFRTRLGLGRSHPMTTFDRSLNARQA